MKETEGKRLGLRFEASRNNITGTLTLFPEDRRDEILFGAWSLKDILGHLNAWTSHQIDVLEAVLEDRVPDKVEGTNEFNQMSQNRRRGMSWQETYDEFLLTSERLKLLAQVVPESLWGKKVWEDREYTLKTYFEIEIEHFREEHLPDVNRYILRDSEAGSNSNP